VIQEAAAVEHDALDALFDRALGDGRADRLRALDVAAARGLVERAFTDGSTVDADTSVSPLMSSITCA
jgi:hypothetical protein